MSVAQAAERRRAISISVLLHIHHVLALLSCLVLGYLGRMNRMLLMRRRRRKRRQGQLFLPYPHTEIHGREGKLNEVYQ